MISARLFILLVNHILVSSRARRDSKCGQKETTEQDPVRLAFKSSTVLLFEVVSAWTMAQTSTWECPRKFPGHLIYSYRTLLSRQAPPLEREGVEWTDEDDAELKRLADYYDPSFGGDS